MTFARPFALDAFERVLPSGIYSVEPENDVLDGMFLPDWLRTSVLIHLPSTPRSPGYAQTLTVPWQDLEAALLCDPSPAVTPTAPGLEEILLEPGRHISVQSDGISETNIRHTIPRPSKRRLSHANAEQ